MNLVKGGLRATLASAAGALALSGASGTASAQDLVDALKDYAEGYAYHRITGVFEEGLYGDRPECYRRDRSSTNSGIFNGSQRDRTYNCDDRNFYPDVRNGYPQGNHGYHGRSYGYGGAVRAPTITMPAPGYSNDYEANVNRRAIGDSRSQAEREWLNRNPYRDTRTTLSETAYLQVLNACAEDKVRSGYNYNEARTACSNTTSKSFKVGR